MRTPEEDNVLGKMVDCLSGSGFVDQVESWCGKHCAAFTKERDGTEAMECDHDLKALHGDFCDLYEKMALGVLQEAGVTLDEFLAICKRNCGEDMEVQFFVEILSSITDFRVFYDMMERKRCDLAEEAK
ncbi:hypothetical protein DIPPA_02829 [Diplonema papillatum]|nr:hypothetical protein DIPPA_02829 [Diplonema papillatum]